MKKTQAIAASFLLSALLLPLAELARAQDASENSSTATASSPSPYGLSADLIYSRSFQEAGDADLQQSLSAKFTPTLKLEAGTLSALFGIDKDLVDEERLSVSDIALSFRFRAIRLNPFLQLAPGLSTRLPLSEDSRIRQSLITSAGASLKLVADFSPARLSGLRATFDLSASQLFHEFKTQTSGALNTQTSLGVTGGLEYALTDALSVSASGRRLARWSYEGNLRTAFDLQAELGLSITEQLSLAGGYSTEGPLLAADGVSSAFKIFDARRSTFYMDLAVTL